MHKHLAGTIACLSLLGGAAIYIGLVVYHEDLCRWWKRRRR